MHNEKLRQQHGLSPISCAQRLIPASAMASNDNLSEKNDHYATSHSHIRMGLACGGRGSHMAASKSR